MTTKELLVLELNDASIDEHITLAKSALIKLVTAVFPGHRNRLKTKINRSGAVRTLRQAIAIYDNKHGQYAYVSRSNKSKPVIKYKKYPKGGHTRTSPNNRRKPTKIPFTLKTDNPVELIRLVQLGTSHVLNEMK